MDVPSPLQQELTPSDVTEICFLADRAYDRAGSYERNHGVPFFWRGHRLTAHLTTFRILVNHEGQALCCRYD